MRHRHSGRKLGRTWEHRKAMFRNMAKSLVTHGRIQTTEAKAKELTKVADKLVTLALRNDLHARRQAYKVLGSHSLVKKLFDEVGPVFASAPTGGYTRVVKLADPRKGDCAPMAIVEFSLKEGETRSPKVKDTTAPAASAAAPTAPAAPAEEAAVEGAEAVPAEEAAVEGAEAVPAEEAAAEESTEAAPAEEAAEVSVETSPEADEAAPAEDAAPEETAEEAADDEAKKD